MSEQSIDNILKNKASKWRKPIERKDSHTEGPRLNKDIKREIEDIKDLEEEVSEMLETEKQPENELRSEIIDLQQELQGSKEKLLYAFAEMENIRSRTKQDIDKTRKYALEKIVNELVPVIDSLERAIESVTHSEKEHPVFGGVQLTLKMLLKAVEKFGVQQINPLHEPFNPQFHEAMSIKEDSEIESDTVLTVLQKGYLLNDRLVRPALVIVSKLV